MEIQAHVRLNQDFNQSDLDLEVENTLFRAYATKKWLDGELETDVFADILAEQQIDFNSFIFNLDQFQAII